MSIVRTDTLRPCSQFHSVLVVGDGVIFFIFLRFTANAISSIVGRYDDDDVQVKVLRPDNASSSPYAAPSLGTNHVLRFHIGSIVVAGKKVSDAPKSTKSTYSEATEIATGDASFGIVFVRVVFLTLQKRRREGVSIKTNRTGQALNGVLGTPSEVVELDATSAFVIARRDMRASHIRRCTGLDGFDRRSRGSVRCQVIK